MRAYGRIPAKWDGNLDSAQRLLSAFLASGNYPETAFCEVERVLSNQSEAMTILRKINVECVDLRGADVPHEKGCVARGEAGPGSAKLARE
jgi:hypothetical protein